MPEQSSQEKTEQATPRRLREARKKGQVAKSRDVSQIAVMIAVFAVFCIMIAFMGREFQKYFTLCFTTLGNNVIEWSLIMDLGKAGLWTMAKVLAPLFASGFAIALVAGVGQVGALFSAEPLKPKPERLNPVEGLKNMFKVVALIELIKNVIKITVVLYLAYQTIAKYIDEVIMSARADLMLTAQITGTMIFEFILKVCIVFLFLSLVDYAVQRWNFLKNMRMTKDEVKREYKQEEGDPAIKGERRRIHREMAFGDVKQAVKQADVVVTNPVHVACALEYNRQAMGAPTLTAKGQEKFAEMIVEIARQEHVPVVRNIPLAWSLLQMEVGDEIPEDLYETVAEVLSMVYEMKKKTAEETIEAGKHHIYV